MKYKVTLNNRVYEVEVEAGKAMLLSEYDAVAPVAAAPVAAPVVAAPAAAPAAAAASAFAPFAMTKTLFVLPVPLGRTSTPRTCWSA